MSGIILTIKNEFNKDTESKKRLFLLDKINSPIASVGSVDLGHSTFSYGPQDKEYVVEESLGTIQARITGVEAEVQASKEHIIMQL
ncbi:MAG: hypothetical protein K9G62_00835 [Alphaproteobacteria bacterium]|nr:hypothetical protein [Alphaproteobacteria bacterium]